MCCWRFPWRGSRSAGRHEPHAALPRWRAALHQKSLTSRSQANHRASVDRYRREKSAIVGVLPNRETRARCPPNVDNFFVGAVAPAEPLEQIQDERFDDVGQEAMLRLS